MRDSPFCFLVVCQLHVVIVHFSGVFAASRAADSFIASNLFFPLPFYYWINSSAVNLFSIFVYGSVVCFPLHSRWRAQQFNDQFFSSILHRLLVHEHIYSLKMQFRVKNYCLEDLVFSIRWGSSSIANIKCDNHWLDGRDKKKKKIAGIRCLQHVHLVWARVCRRVRHHAKSERQTNRRGVRPYNRISATDYTNKSIYCIFFCAFGQSLPVAWYFFFVVVVGRHIGFYDRMRRIKFILFGCRRVLIGSHHSDLMDNKAMRRWQTINKKTVNDWWHVHTLSIWSQCFNESGHSFIGLIGARKKGSPPASHRRNSVFFAAKIFSEFPSNPLRSYMIPFRKAFSAVNLPRRKFSRVIRVNHETVEMHIIENSFPANRNGREKSAFFN